MALINRRARVSRQVQRKTHDIMREIFPKDLVVVTQVVQAELGPDLSNAKIFVSFSEGLDSEALLAQLNAKKHLVRKALASSISIKKVPKVNFCLDEVTYSLRQMQELISSLNDEGDRSSSH